MKKTIIMACIALSLSASATTTSKPGPSSPSAVNKVINNYIESFMSSNYKMLNSVLDDDACVKIPRSGQVVKHSKASLLEQMKSEKGTQQNCESSYEVLDKSDAIVIAKVNFKYNEFIQHNYLVLERNADNEWKVTQICKIFEDIKTDRRQAAENITASNLKN